MHPPPPPPAPAPLEGELAVHGGDVIQPSLAEVLKCLPAWTAVLSLCLFLLHLWTLIASAGSSPRCLAPGREGGKEGGSGGEEMERDPGWMLVVAAEAERSPPLTPKHTFKFELMGGGESGFCVYFGRGGLLQSAKDAE